MACILLPGCALRTGSRAYHSPAPASAGLSQTSTASTPRNTAPDARPTEVRQTPVTNSQHVAFLSPRMQGAYHSNSNFESLGAPAAKASPGQPSAPEESVADKTIAAQPTDSNTSTSGRISSQQILAADLLPLAEPHYAGPLAVVIIFVGLIYYALYRIAGSGGQTARTNSLEADNRSRGEYPVAGQGSGSGSRLDDVRSSPGIAAGSSGAGEPVTHRRDADGNKPGEPSQETASPATTGNASTVPRTDHQYETSLFDARKTDSTGPSVVFQYDKDGHRVEKSESKTEFFSGSAQGAVGNPVKDFRPKE
jgi:hypothetical protein